MPERKLTDADCAAIAEQFHAMHVCRFNNIAPEDMSFVKDLLSLYKETRSEVIKWLVRGVIYGALVVITVATYFKFKGIK